MKLKWNRATVFRIVAIALGLFFIYAGGKKLFLPPAPRPEGPSSIPSEFIYLIKALKASGYFMVVVAWSQLVAGCLLLWKRTELIGSLLLAPITFNIFIMHVMIDNRPDENIFTGFLFFANAILVFQYFNRLIIAKE